MMTPFFRPAIVALVLIAGGSPAAQALTWEAPEQSVKIEAGVSEAIIEFPFKNNASVPVTLVDVKTGCECSVPELPKQPIPAAGSGVLKVRYRPGTSPGTRQVSVQVRTDETGDAANTTLSFKATVESVLTIAPVLTRWSRSDPVTPKKVTISGTGVAPITRVALAPLPATVTATLAPGPNPATWILSVAPVSTETNLTVKVAIEAEVNGRSLSYSAYVIVR